MGFDGLVFGFSAVVSMVGIAAVGGVFVAAAWAEVLRERGTDTGWRISTALCSFTISVGLQAITYLLLNLTPLGHQPVVVTASVILFAFASSFVSLLFSMTLVRSGSGPGTRIVAIGSKTVFVIALIGLVGILIGLPGATDNPQPSLPEAMCRSVAKSRQIKSPTNRSADLGKIDYLPTLWK